MTDDPCADCDPTVDKQAVDESGGRRDAVIETESPLEAELPVELQSSLGRFLGDGPVRTLGEWASAVRQETGGGPISVEELCHADGETAHWGMLDGDRYHFACFYDAVILAAMTDRPVDVRTESPDGSVVEARAVGSDELTVSPPGAVFSFGIDETVVSADGGAPAVDDGYAAICPLVRAFPDPDAYRRWAATAPAATAALPLEGATDLAAALVSDP